MSAKVLQSIYHTFRYDRFIQLYKSSITCFIITCPDANNTKYTHALTINNVSNKKINHRNILKIQFVCIRFNHKLHSNRMLRTL